MSLAGILKSERTKLEKLRQKGATKEALDLIDEFSGLAKPSATFNEVLSEYRTLSQRLSSGGNSPLFQNTGRAIQ